MKVEFYRPVSPRADDRTDPQAPPPSPVGTATWTDDGPVIECDDGDLRAALQHAFRKTPVVTDDASYRRFGTFGEVLIQPGSLEWFRVVAFVRVPEEAGLETRLVPGITEGGFDPAAGYRRFEDAIERLAVHRPAPR
ncbi:MAG TPA: hypothetical protein VG993_10380 [Actinomycetota bacterium]|jgi:hypothetical protein|nr:hypothetical protein [Actinomycetota bacterium]